jgi:membrane-bound lytic murein transglycosylase D
VLREINRQRVGYFDRFWDVYQRLPRETRRYVPRFLATLAIVEDPARYGFDLPEPLPPVEFDVVNVERAAGLEGLEDALGLGDGTLIALNPELRQGAVPDASYPLRVPAGFGDAVSRQIASLPEWKAPSGTGVHRVRRGETLSGIAGRYGTSVRELMALNRLRSAHRIWPGQQLQVPGGPGGTRLPPGTEVNHRVRRGDSLWLLASRYGTTVEQIRRDNGLRGSTLYPGQVLRVRSSGSGGGSSYVVRRGDTLGAIARRQGVSLSRLLAANNLSRRSTIYPGQRLVIPR